MKSLFLCFATAGLVVAFVLLPVSVSWANESEEDSPSVLEGVGTLVDDTHEQVSDRFSRFVVRIDDYIASGESDQELNKSRLRLRINAVKPGGESGELSGKLKLRIVLPRTENRFRLLLSNEDDDDSSSANSDAAQREQIAADANSEVAFALRFIRSVKSRVQLKYDIGARVKDSKAQIFGRFIAGYEKPGALGVTHSYTNNLTLFSSSGYRNTFSVNSIRNFEKHKWLFIRNSLEFSARKGLKGIGIGNTLGIYADLGATRALAIEGITGYSTALNSGETDRYRGAEFRMRFRHSVWRPWFYYEIWPSVSWSSSNDYKKAYGGTFRIEVTFGNI